MIHNSVLSQAKGLGDYLVVGIHSDGKFLHFIQKKLHSYTSPKLLM